MNTQLIIDYYIILFYTYIYFNVLVAYVIDAICADSNRTDGHRRMAYCKRFSNNLVEIFSLLADLEKKEKLKLTKLLNKWSDNKFFNAQIIFNARKACGCGGGGGDDNTDAAPPNVVTNNNTQKDNNNSSSSSSSSSSSLPLQSPSGGGGSVFDISGTGSVYGDYGLVIKNGKYYWCGKPTGNEPATPPLSYDDEAILRSEQAMNSGTTGVAPTSAASQQQQQQQQYNHQIYSRESR